MVGLRTSFPLLRAELGSGAVHHGLRSFDAYSLDGKLENQNDIKMWERRKENGMGTWIFMEVEPVGPDSDETKWEGDTYIPKNSIIMLRLRFQFFCSSVGYGVSLRFGRDIAVLQSFFLQRAGRSGSLTPYAGPQSRVVRVRKTLHGSLTGSIKEKYKVEKFVSLSALVSPSGSGGNGIATKVEIGGV